MLIVQQLKTYCMEKDITQFDMAKILDMRNSTLNAYFNWNEIPNMVNRKKMEAFLEINFDYNIDRREELIEDPVQKLKDFKKEHGYTFKQLGDLLDVKWNTIRGWIYQGNNPRPPSIYKINKLLLKETDE